MVHDIFFAIFVHDYELAIKPLASSLLMVSIFELLVLLVVLCFTLPLTTNSLQGLPDDLLTDRIQLGVSETRHQEAVASIDPCTTHSDHKLIDLYLGHLVEILVILSLWLRRVAEAHHLWSCLMTPL